MKTYECLGTAPYDEDCVQVSDKEYLLAMRAECQRFKAMLERRFPGISEGCYFNIKSFPHDFGVYLEVVLMLDFDKIEHQEYFYWVDNDMPETWDNDDILPFVFSPDEEEDEEDE